VTKLRGLPFEPTAVADGQAAIVLIEKGRPDMALAILRGVPARLQMDVVELAGRASLRAHQRRVAKERGDPPAPAPKPPTPATKEPTP
jgi:hypothetical protein